MGAFVPNTTPIKRSRVGNIDTNRLRRRRGFVIRATRSSRDFESRMDFVARVAEIAAIEDELVRRGELSSTHRHTVRS